MKRKICFLTGTRAEYGIIKPILAKIENENELELQIVVTGMHLSPEFGMTYREIEEDGYFINEKIETLLSSDSSVGISKSVALCILSFSEVIQRLNPDLIIVTGDRFETLGCTIPSFIMRKKILHLYGGEVTHGSLDDSIRHSITKYSDYHLTSTEEYKKRILQLGESKNNVFNVGSTAVESIKKMKLLNKNEIEKSLKIKLEKTNALMTFHPITVEEGNSTKYIKEILESLIEFDNLKTIITMPNSDQEGRSIIQEINKYTKKYPDKFSTFQSLGQLRYLSLMNICDFVIGNSSSGIIETPSFKKPTINIGNRQNGRLKSKNIIDCEQNKKKIIKSINEALSYDFRKICEDVKNPYDGENTIEKIYNLILRFSEENKKEKIFNDIIF